MNDSPRRTEKSIRTRVNAVEMSSARVAESEGVLGEMSLECEGSTHPDLADPTDRKRRLRSRGAPSSVKARKQSEGRRRVTRGEGRGERESDDASSDEADGSDSLGTAVTEPTSSSAAALPLPADGARSQVETPAPMLRGARAELAETRAPMAASASIESSAAAAAASAAHGHEGLDACTAHTSPHTSQCHSGTLEAGTLEKPLLSGRATSRGQ